MDANPALPTLVTRCQGQWSEKGFYEEGVVAGASVDLGVPWLHQVIGTTVVAVNMKMLGLHIADPFNIGTAKLEFQPHAAAHRAEVAMGTDSLLSGHR
jgi:hypothetical protein